MSTVASALTTQPGLRTDRITLPLIVSSGDIKLFSKKNELMHVYGRVNVAK